MSRRQNPLVLMMALSMPGAAHALGLGDIHVGSKLNEPLAADIDIFGATAEELVALRASVADHETFLRYGVERPAFLSSITFKVAQDTQGRPVLAVRSSESFTEPLVNILVDVSWGRGEVVREYTLLLDPAVLASETRAAEGAAAQAVQAAPDSRVAPAAATAVAATAILDSATTTASEIDPQTNSANPSDTAPADQKVSTFKVGAKATLRGIAWRAGARSESDLQRLMIAIFRANPAAFKGNINVLLRGALVTIPGLAQVSAISAAEAKSEIHAQMAAWQGAAKPMRAAAAAVHAGAATVEANTVAPSPAPGDAQPGPSVPNDAPAKDADTAASESLSHRVQLMEQSLHELNRDLKSGEDTLVGLRLQVARAQTPAIAASTAHSPAASKPSVLASIMAGIGMLGGSFAGGYFWNRRRPAQEKKSQSARPAVEHVPVQTHLNIGAAGSLRDHAPDIAQDVAQYSAPVMSTANAIDDTVRLPLVPEAVPQKPAEAAATRRASDRRASDSGDATDTFPADSASLDNDTLELSMTAQHVWMPSVLHQHTFVKERRTSVVDVLRAAIDREPDRNDLRLKLLELYYAAAATNRQGFLEIVQKLANERDLLADGEWDKVAFMGRQIAAENPLFSDPDADKKLADCA